MVAVFVMAVAELSASGGRPSGFSAAPIARPGTTASAVVWLAETASLMGDHARPRPGAHARALGPPDEPGERSLAGASVALLAAGRALVRPRAGRGLPAAGRRGPRGSPIALLRPG